MKAKRVRRIAEGKTRRSMVLRGCREKTALRLTKDMLVTNKFLNAFPHKASAFQGKLYQMSAIKVSAQRVVAARKALSWKGAPSSPSTGSAQTTRPSNAIPKDLHVARK
ncbi:unnamed protein product [Prorocentrum cordatum]|uniref:Uncharacterized protein n=1 Tax=Prorocentrum cordatum TaxID=2364126 RepID=A0ABN9V5Y5_9DINO|nr:unnamed protein product [Polarella glacialis]